MSDHHTRRIAVHIAAILLSIAMWWIFSEFAVALGASLAAFLLLTAIGHLAYGPMPTGDDLRKDIEDLLRRRRE